MRVYNGLTGLNKPSNLVVALGNFDGLHIGHQKLIHHTRLIAQEIGGVPAVFTLDPHPLKVLQPESFPPLLLTKADKIKCLENLGVEVLVIADFSTSMANMDPEDFVTEILIQGLQAKVVVVGFNYSFGRGGKGTPALLERIFSIEGRKVETVPPVRVNDKEVSSTAIRQLILRGQVDVARNMLGYYPFLKGPIRSGAQLGRQIGFPTANLDIPEYILAPAKGVYLSRADVKGNTYYGVTNIGSKPTLNKVQPQNVEVHLMDFSDDIYGLDIKVEFLQRLRDEKKFATLADLSAQIIEDVKRAQSLISQTAGNN